MIFDSDVLIWVFRDNARAVALFDSVEERIMSVVTYMELVRGARDSGELRETKDFVSSSGLAVRLDKGVVEFTLGAEAMMKATALDLRRKLREVLEAVDRGETVTILYRGKERAKLVPLNNPKPRRKSITESPLFGMWKDREDMRDVDAYVRKLRGR